jgi:hypothetical protein
MRSSDLNSPHTNIIVIQVGCHTSSVERSVGDIGLEDGEVAGGQELHVISGDHLRPPG